MSDDLEFAYRLFKAREDHDSLPTLSGLTCFLVVLFFQVAGLEPIFLGGPNWPSSTICCVPNRLFVCSELLA